MFKALLRDPFWVPLSEVAKMTDRVMWEHYIRPALEESRRTSQEDRRIIHGAPAFDDSEPAGPSAVPEIPGDQPGVVDAFGNPVSLEKFLRSLGGWVPKERVEEVLAEQRRREEAQNGS